MAGGAAAVLGDTANPEASDPAFLAAARFGGGFSFAAGQHISWPAMLGATNAFTLELWVKPGATGDIFNTGDGKFVLRYQGQSFVAQVGSATVTSANAAGSAWHHVIVSFTQPSLRLWVDGVRTEVDNVSPNMPIAMDTLTISGTGSVDEVWLAQTAITTDDAARARYCPL